MELLVGASLAVRLQRGRLPLVEALSVCLQIGKGVEAAHDAALIHRDLKPSNILLTHEGKAKVLDFGLARASQPTAEDGDEAAGLGPPSVWDGTLTRPHAILGTPGYMSPEQTRGQPMDRRTDIFSFGLVVFECLTGTPAFHGESAADLIAAVLEREPDWAALPPEVPPRVRALLQRCLAKEVSRRMRDIGDACLEIEEALREARPDGARPPPQPAPAPRARRGRVALAVAGAAVAAAGGAAITLALTRSPGTAAPAPPGPPAPPAPAQPIRQLDIAYPRPQTELSKLGLTLAKDGSQLVFAASGPDGVLRLWSRRFADGTTAELSSTEDGWHPTLSPDGQWVAFYREGGLWKRRLVGGDSVKIARASWWGGGTAWGTDDVLSFFPEWGQGMVRIPAQRGEARTVTEILPDRGDLAQMLPCALPDGRAVLFTSWSGREDSRIEVVELASGARTTVVQNGSTPRFARTPRGDHLLWERKGTIYAARFDAATRRVTGPEHPIVDGVLTDGAHFAAFFESSDEATLAWIPGPVYYEESRLVWIREGQPSKPFMADVLPFGEPRFSADGRKLSVLVKRKVYAPYVREEGRGTFDRVVFENDVESGAISPDGRSFAFSSNRGGRYSVWLKQLATGEERQLIEPRGNFAIGFDWSPDGRHIALSMSPDAGPLRDVWIVTPGDKIEVRRFLDGPTDERFPRFSPDGRWLAYTADEGDAREVFVRSFPDGKLKRQISVRGGTEPAWAPDGKRIYYRSDGKLYAVPLSREDARPVGPPIAIHDRPFGQADSDVANYTVAPDGRILVVEPAPQQTQVTRIQVMLGWHLRLP
jgi:Tol biopolymer transport system component